MADGVLDREHDCASEQHEDDLVLADPGGGELS
jgi:hypothetical protein